jgi:DHA2 family methylenomycin A resistance protein-like MFS transporter
MTTSGFRVLADRTAAGRPASRRGALLTVMCAGMFLVQLDVTVVNVALPHIGAALHAGVSGLQWIVDAYSVVLAALLLTAGVSGDRFGHRSTVLTGLLLFGLSSLGCSLAPSAGALIGFRAAQGLAAAVLLPGTLAVISRAYPERREHARALGIWAGVSALALPTGPVLGGLLVTGAGWRTVFWINLPVVAVAFAAARRLIPRYGGDGSARLDVPGMVFAAVTLGALVFAVISARQTLVAMCAGAVCVLGAVCFLVRERSAAAPMLPLELLRSRAFTGANAVSAAMNFVGIGSIFVLTLYLQQVRGNDPLVAGAMLLPLFAPLAIMAPVTGRVAARIGPRIPMIGGLALGAAGGLALVLASTDGSYVLLLPCLLGIGLGMGLLTTSVVTAAMRACPPERQGLASGTNNTARQAAGALGVAVFGSVAGSPADAGSFVAGLHTIGIMCAALWLAAIAVTVWAVD